MLNREIERKFLVIGEPWLGLTEGELCRQGYAVSGPPLSVRVRTIGARGYLTLKHGPVGARTATGPIERMEFEYEIPVAEADQMLETLCTARLEKTRFKLEHEGRVWDVDRFRSENEGLVVAEIELVSVGEAFALPSWAGREVTGDPRYLNSNLARLPFSRWDDVS